MNKSVTRIITILLSVSILLSAVSAVTAFAEATYDEFTVQALMDDPDKYPLKEKMTAAEGFTTYENYAYSVKVSSDNNYATIYRTNLKKKNDIVQLEFKSNNKNKTDKNIKNTNYYYKKLGHANDMTAVNINGHLYLFVATGDVEQQNSFVQLRVNNKNVSFVKGYDHFTNKTNETEKNPTEISGIAVMTTKNKETFKSNDKISFLLKKPNSYKFYKMYFTVDSNSDELVSAKSYDSNDKNLISKDNRIKAEDKLSKYVNGLTGSYCTQGIYFDDNTVYMPITKIKPDDKKNRFRNKSMIISFPYKLFNNADSEAKNIKAAYRLKAANEDDSYQFEVEGCSLATVKGKKRMCFCANRDKSKDRDIIGYINKEHKN